MHIRGVGAGARAGAGAGVFLGSTGRCSASGRRSLCSQERRPAAAAGSSSNNDHVSKLSSIKGRIPTPGASRFSARGLDGLEAGLVRGMRM